MTQTAYSNPIRNGLRVRCPVTNVPGHYFLYSTPPAMIVEDNTYLQTQVSIHRCDEHSSIYLLHHIQIILIIIIPEKLKTFKTKPSLHSAQKPVSTYRIWMRHIYKKIEETNKITENKKHNILLRCIYFIQILCNRKK